MDILFIDCGGNMGQSLLEFSNYIKKIHNDKKLVLDSICIEPSKDIKVIDPLKKQINKLKKQKIYRNIKFFNLCLNSTFNPINFWDNRQSGSTTIREKSLWDPQLLLHKPTSKTYIRAIVRLFKRIFIQKPITVSSAPLDVFLPYKSQYSSYYLKIDIEGGEYTVFNENNLNLLKANPPKKIFIEFHTIKCGKKYFQTLELFKKLREIAPLHYWQCDIGNFKEQIEMFESDIFYWYANEISLMKNLSLSKKDNITIRLMRHFFKIHITYQLFNKSLRASNYLYPTDAKMRDIKKEIILHANKINSLFCEIDRKFLIKEINNLKNKFDKLKKNSIFVNNYSNEKKDLSTLSQISNKKDLLYSYLKDVSLVKKEILEIDNIINKQLKNKGLYFLHLAGINLRISFPNQNNLAHTLKWHKDYNGWFVIKAFVPLDIQSEPFLEYLDCTHRKNPYISYPSRVTKGLLNSKRFISNSKISLVNTSCLHRENTKKKESNTLIITYLPHPDYNDSKFKL